MALTDEGNNMVMPVSPMYGNGGGMGFGGDWSSWIILFLIFGMFGGGWGNGFGGGYGGGLGYDFPWLLNGQNGINANTNSGFDHLATQNMLGGIQGAVTSGFGDVQTALCGGFAGVNASINGAQNAVSQQLYTNQISDLERSFAAQTANDGVKAQVEAKNDRISELQTQLNMAALRESQTAQNAFIQQGFSNEVDALYNRLNSCPVPTTPVYGRTPIFQCQNNGCGCGCGCGA